MKVVGAVCVRMGSSRLPGKALHVVEGQPLLGHLLGRLRRARSLDEVVVATSTRAENDAIAAFCATLSIPCFRGDEDDVLGRLLGALQSQQAGIGVNVFGDGPLIDPAIVDTIVGKFSEAGGALDFVGNDLETTWPSGMEVEVFSVRALADADSRCSDPPIREHGTLFIRKNPSLYSLMNVEAPPELRRTDLSLEVDASEDLVVMEALLEYFRDKPDAGLLDYIRYLDGHPEVAAAGREVHRRWKEFRGT